MRPTVHTPLCLCLLWACATAQAEPPVTPPGAAPAPAIAQDTTMPQSRQRVERIRIEDSGARVDEVRYGGVTQSITVQPAANVPGYEVLPSTSTQARPGNSADIGAGQGVRVWKFLNF